MGVTSPEIQEVEEGSGAGPMPGLEEDGARNTNIVRSTWAATYEADTLDDEGEEAATCPCLEQGLGWARRALDELILPVTSVSPRDLGT